MRRIKRTLLVAVSALLLGLPGIRAEAGITNGLVGHWTFDETNGTTVADSSAQGNNGTVYNSDNSNPVWVAGQIGGALTFRGVASSGDFVDITSFPAPTNTFSVSAWVTFHPQSATWSQFGIVENGLTDNSGPIGLVVQPKDLDMEFGPLGEQSYTGGGTVTANDTVAFPTNVWQHIAVVADGSRIKLYRNGVQVGAATYSGALPLASTPDLGIGGILDSSTFAHGLWEGLIDDVGIWTNALTAGQVLSIYNAGKAGKDLTLADQYQDVPPSFSAQPASVSRYVGEGVSFSVTAAGSAPLYYQWLLNGQPVAGATNSTYIIPNVTLDQSNAQFTVMVSNALTNAVSQPATLTVTATTFATALAGYWTFDETNGVTAADSSGNGDPVNLANYPGDNSQWTSGQIGGALQIGTNNTEYCSADSYPKPTTTMTISAWVWVSQETHFGTFLKNWGYTQAGQFHWSTDGVAETLNARLFITESDGADVSVTDPQPLATNQWEQIGFVLDGLMVRLYRNGFEVASVPYDGTLLASPPMNCLGFGTRMDDACGSALGEPDYLFGKLDDAGLWTRGLTASEMYAIYAAGQDHQGLINAAPYLPKAPSILTQPASVAVFEGKTVNLTVNASGATPLVYQWYRNSQPVPGGTDAMLTLTRVSTANAGVYDVLVTNNLGGITSSNAVVVVNKRALAPVVSQWKFENNLLDSSTNGNDGTAAGSVAYVPGRFGMAVSLDPGNSIINSSPNNMPASATNSWSMNLWVDLSTTPPALSYLAGFGPAAVLEGAGTARALLAYSGIYEWGNSDDLSTGVQYPLNSWAMVTLTFDGADSERDIYLNGQWIAGGTLGFADIPAGTDAISLAPTSFWGSQVGGVFDEFTIFSDVLPPDQINQLLGLGIPLDISLSGRNVEISWSVQATGFSLESATNLNGVWTAVSGVASNSVSIPIGNGTRFFRLKE